MTLAMVFPGQGSQAVGMQAALADDYAQVRETYAEASELLGYDLWQRVQDGPAEELNSTVVTQPAMLAAGVATWRIWQARGGTAPSYLAGHSLGEYTALVCSGALEFADAVPLVKRRAELMQNAVAPDEAAMAALLGLDDADVESICAAASDAGIVEAVNFNAPGQVVVSGQKAAVNKAVLLAKDAGARRAILLSVSVPSHSSLMRDAAEALADALAATPFSAPGTTVIGTTDVKPYAGANDIRDALKRQLYSPVQWVKTVAALRDAGADAIIECGPGKVLAGLCRRIDRAMPAACLDSPDALDKALAQ